MYRYYSKLKYCPLTAARVTTNQVVWRTLIIYIYIYIQSYRNDKKKKKESRYNYNE